MVHFYEPSKGHGLRHDPFNAIVGPRPIGWISTVSADGILNLAPYSFFNAFNYMPPIIGFSSVGAKDTLRNVEATGEFVWNLATEPLAQAMNATSAVAPADVDEFALSGLTPEPSRLIKPPRVGESPVAFECKLTQLVPLMSANGDPTPATMVFGEVIGVHIDSELLKDGAYITTAAQPLLRGGGPGDYFTISENARFVMMRPS